LSSLNATVQEEEAYRCAGLIDSRPKQVPRVCVTLTAYNDGAAIARAVKEFLSQENVVRVLVVDNNSRDQTSSEATEAGAKVVHERHQGYGFACMRGLKEALRCTDADVVVLAEGDMTFRGRDIQKLLPYLDDVDMVIGSRTHMALVEPDSQMDWFYLWGNMFLAKMLQLRFFNLRFLGRVRFTDVGCTMRAIRKDSLAKIIDKLDVGDHHFSPHMAIVALRNGLRVVEVPITFRKRVGLSNGAGGNKTLAIKVGLTMLWHILSQ
jgi:glycosyltransferase involved in cell wall biosynthesis